MPVCAVRDSGKYSQYDPPSNASPTPFKYPEGDEELQGWCPGYQPRCVEKMSSVGPTSVRYWKKWPGLGTRNGSTIHQACDQPAGLSMQEKR